MVKPVEPKKILCIHDLSGAGRSSLSVILPVLTAMGHQAVALPTAVLSTHTGGLGAPAHYEDDSYLTAALEHYREIGLSFDCIYSGYLATPAQAAAVKKAHGLWPAAYKIVDPVMGDHGRRYDAVSNEMADAMRQLCGGADLILPNLTEACLLLGTEYPEGELDRTAAVQLAQQLLTLSPAAVITGITMGKYTVCAGAGTESFTQRNIRLGRSFPGTGDLFGAVTAGCLLRGNALSAAVDAAAEFVSHAIQATGPDADTRLGVWYESELWRLMQRV